MLYWGVNPGLRTCYVTTLPTYPHHNPEMWISNNFSTSPQITQPSRYYFTFCSDRKERVRQGLCNWVRFHWLPFKCLKVIRNSSKATSKSTDEWLGYAVCWLAPAVKHHPVFHNCALGFIYRGEMVLCWSGWNFLWLSRTEPWHVEIQIRCSWGCSTH